MRENIVGSGNECRATKEQNQNVVGGGLESVITEKAIVKHSFQGNNQIRSMQSKQASKSNEDILDEFYLELDKALDPTYPIQLDPLPPQKAIKNKEETITLEEAMQGVLNTLHRKADTIGYEAFIGGFENKANFMEGTCVPYTLMDNSDDK